MCTDQEYFTIREVVKATSRKLHLVSYMPYSQRLVEARCASRRGLSLHHCSRPTFTVPHQRCQLKQGWGTPSAQSFKAIRAVSLPIDWWNVSRALSGRLCGKPLSEMVPSQLSSCPLSTKFRRVDSRKRSVNFLEGRFWTLACLQATHRRQSKK
jgi:hypothetical protein